MIRTKYLIQEPSNLDELLYQIQMEAEWAELQESEHDLEIGIQEDAPLEFIWIN